MGTLNARKKKKKKTNKCLRLGTPILSSSLARRHHHRRRRRRRRGLDRLFLVRWGKSASRLRNPIPLRGGGGNKELCRVARESTRRRRRRWILNARHRHRDRKTRRWNRRRFQTRGKQGS